MSESGGGPYHERRSSSGRFLPPDPRVREPHRLTRALAVRVAVLGGVALLAFGILFLRLWSLQVLSGDEYLNAAQNNQLRLVRVEAPRGPILDRRGRAIVSNVAGTAVQLWTGDMPKEGRYELVRRLAKVLNVSPAALAREVEERRGDPVTPILVKSSVGEEQVNYLYEHQAEFPGVEIVQVYLRDYTYNTLAAQILGLRRRDLPRGAQAAEKGRLSRRRPRRQGGRRGRLRHVPARARRPCSDPGRLARPAAVRTRAAAGAESGIRAPAHAGRALAACGRGSAPLRDQPRPPDRQLGSERRRDRRARPRRRGRAGDGFLAYVQAVGLRRAHRSEEARAAPGRGGGASRELPGPEPRHCGAVSDRARPGSPSPRSPGCRSTSSRRTTRSSARRSPTTASTGSPSATGTPSSTGRCRFRKRSPSRATPTSTKIGDRFYQRGSEGRVRMQQWARRFGFGQATGLDIGGEAEGLLPTPNWRWKTFESDWDRAWNPGDSIQLSIGQKDLLVTPLQMAAFYAMLANGGDVVTPYLVSDVEQPRAKGSPRGRSPPVRATPAAILRHRPCRARRRPRRALPCDALHCRHLVRRLRRATRSRSRARRGLPRRSFRFRAIRATTSRTSRGGAAGGRRTTRRSSSAR